MAGSGHVTSYREFESCANRCAHLFRSLGMRRGDHIAIMMENHPLYLQICWGAQRAGLYYTPVSWRLQADEVFYIISNCDARIFITSSAVKSVVRSLPNSTSKDVRCFMADGAIEGFDSLEAALSRMPEGPIADQSEGALMPYSSGTTGYPKGISRPLSGAAYGQGDLFPVMTAMYGATGESIFLSPAPLYHSAPLGFCMTCLRHGITVVVMEKFEPEFALETIQRYRVTHSQWVPTMFVRMLKLAEEPRTRFDISSLRYAIHGAAPCPVPVKEQMIEWWGEVLYEYYAGSEANGFVHIDSADWLSHRGSVGRPMGCEIHICGEDGKPVAIGEHGVVWFDGGTPFEYHKDDQKTAGSRNALGWSTLGDIGYLDDEGYLYLTDRQHFVIISGGLNIYPQEIENTLILHDDVMDVAVFGIPNEDFGEEVKAAIQLKDPSQAGDGMAAELIAFCRDRLSHAKCPRSVDFHVELPRHPTGKLYKRLLKQPYWADR